MSKMGVENSIFVRLLIQRTSTKNFYFIPSPQSAVRVLYLVRVLYPVHIFQSAFYTYTAFYTQSAVPSPQSVFYTDRSLSRQLQRVSTVNDNHFENWIQNNG